MMQLFKKNVVGGIVVAHLPLYTQEDSTVFQQSEGNCGENS